MLLEMEGGDSVLAALEEFSKKPSDAIPTVLEEYLIRVSKTGETQFPWAKCKILIQRKVDASMKKFNAEMPYDGIAAVPNAEVVRFDDMRRNILAAIDSFTGAPFTIQRLCELVTDPKRHYTRTDKFLRGLEKNVLVVTTVDPWGRKISSDRSAVRALIVNGMSPSGGQHSSSGGCTPLRSPAATGPPQDSVAITALCQAQGDAVVKDDANMSPAQDSPISNGSSSSSSSSSISSFEGEHADGDDGRAGGLGSTTEAGVGRGGLPVVQKTDSASATTGVKRPCTDSLFSVKPAKQPCLAATRLPDSDAASGAVTCGDGDGANVAPVPPSSSSELVASTVESSCTGDDDAPVCVTASTGDVAGSGTSDTRLGTSDSESAESLRPMPACPVTKDGPAEHDSGVVSCGKPTSTPRSSAKGDGDSAEAAAAASASAVVQAATTEADVSGSPVDGGDSSSGGSPSKLCCPASLPPPSIAAPLAAEAAVSDST